MAVFCFRRLQQVSTASFLLLLGALGAQTSRPVELFAGLQRGHDIIATAGTDKSYMVRVDSGRSGTALCAASGSLKCCSPDDGVPRYLVAGPVDLPAGFSAKVGLKDGTTHPHAHPHTTTPRATTHTHTRARAHTHARTHTARAHTHTHTALTGWLLLQALS